MSGEEKIIKRNKSMSTIIRIRSFFSKFPQLGTFIAFILIIVFFASLSPVFITARNISNILQQTGAISIASFGMTLVLLVGGIDLCIGSIVALVGVVCAKLLSNGYSIPIVILVGLIMGAAVGLMNGLIITRWRIQPFLVTLGMMSVVRGLALVVSEGQSTYVSNENFKNIFSSGSLLNIQAPIIWTFILLIVLYFIASRTTLGRRVQAIGGSEEAAFLSGIKVKKIKVIVYTINGLMVSLSALVILSRLGTGLPSVGQGFELEAIAATVLGGTGFLGEGGNMFGTLLGSLVIGTAINGLTILGVSPYIQVVVKGVIIILTIIGINSIKTQKINR